MDYGLIDITYRSRLTLLNMLQARGYNITPYSKFSTKEIEMMIGPNMLGKALRMDLERPVERADVGGTLPESVLTMLAPPVETGKGKRMAVAPISKAKESKESKAKLKKKQMGGAESDSESDEESNTNNSSSANTNSSSSANTNSNSNTNNSSSANTNNSSSANTNNSSSANTNTNTNNSSSETEDSTNNESSNVEVESTVQREVRERKETLVKTQDDYKQQVAITRCVVVYSYTKIKGKVESFIYNGYLNKEIDSELRVNPRTTEMIVLVTEPVVEVFHAEALRLFRTYGLRIRFFECRTIVNDPTKYAIVPKHEKLSEEDLKNVMKEHYIQAKTQLPIIRFHEDMQARWLGLFPGDVVKITRGSPSAGEYIIYRVCFP